MFILPLQSQNIVINEILSDNVSGIEDNYGEHSDWIELYNPTNSVVNLQGYYLSDDEEHPLKWRFPTVSIAPYGYILVFASDKPSIGAQLHANFKLSKDGEILLLSNSNGNLIHQYDPIPMRTDVSYGYKPDGSAPLKFFSDPTPGSANNTSAYNGFVDIPELSLLGGFYPDPVDVTITNPGANITFRYTLDGSEPNSNSVLYSGPLHFVNRENSANGISMIPTNPSFDYPKPGFTESRANSRGWLEPYTVINKTNVLKVKAFKTGYLPSYSVTESYFINPQTNNRYTLPVISITTDEEGFFSDETGIYVYGTTGELGNYYEAGREWERQITFQLFENDGSQAIKQDLGIRTHGAGGRHSTLKNMRLYSREEYGKSKFKYKWFENDDTKEFERFLLRGPGHRPDCAPRDDFADLLIQNLDMDLQHIRHTIVFLNGEYWGIHTVKERFDQDYLSAKYGKKKKDYVILKNSGTLHSGEPEDVEVYYSLLDFVTESDMTLEENYDYVKNQIDMDNYLSYYTSQIFMGNADWINTNVKFWRYKGFDKNQVEKSALDGRWRWFMFDFDVTFGGSCKEISYTVNMLDNSFDPSYGRATKLAIGLKRNEQWRFDFVNRMCDLMNSSYNHKRFEEKVDEIDAIMTPEMMEHTERWRYPSKSETLAERQYEVPSMTKWNETIEGLHRFNDNRKRKIITHMQNEFNLSDTICVILDVNDMAMGNIQINSIFVSEALDGISNQVYPWAGTYFKNVPIPLIAISKLGYRFVEWQESGETQDTIIVDIDECTNFTAVFEKDPDFVFEDALYINEFMASNNRIIQDEYGAYADWIEIYNPNNKAVDIAGFFLSDNADDVYKYQFPRGSKNTIIPALGYKLIWADNRSERGVLHTNFNLSIAGEDLVLRAPDSSLIDNLTFGVQQEDISYGRENDGSNAWKFFQKPIGPTPGKTNNNAPVNDISKSDLLAIYPNPVSQGRNVYFNEVMDIEVYNSTGQILLRKEHTTKLSTKSLKTGMYFIKTGESGVVKLIIE
jgi:hypothetical protein